MATSKELFERKSQLQLGKDIEMILPSGEFVRSRVEIVQDFDGCSKYLKIYIPECSCFEVVLFEIIKDSEELIWKPSADILADVGFVGYSESTKSSDLKFSGRVLVYTPAIIGAVRRGEIAEKMAAVGLNLLIRDGDYANLVSKYETPIAFISHDSRDKSEFVRELADRLQSMLCPVWYDEYKLVPGQSLRESIEAGLKACKKCIVVLSKNYFNNPGWGRREFDSIYTREIVEGQRVMIPIWLDVTRAEVYDYSPILADTLGIDASIGLDQVARKVMIALNYEAPKVPNRDI